MPSGWRRVWPASSYPDVARYLERQPVRRGGAGERLAGESRVRGQPITEQQAHLLVTQGQALLDQANLLLS